MYQHETVHSLLRFFLTGWPAATLALLALLVAAGACSGLPASRSADLVILNGKIVTMDPSRPQVQALAAQGEEIVAAGDDREIEKWIQLGRTRVIDAGGRLVLPGFNDTHLHFLGGGNSMKNLDFRYIGDVAVIQRMVAEKVKSVRPGTLITGRGWDHENFPGKQWPTRQLLDAVAPDHPVVLSRTDGHSVWVNSLALRLSGITRQTPDPAGGTIVRDPATGEPTGILKEEAENLLKLTTEEPVDADEESMELALQAARECGVTSVQHLNGNVDVLQRLYDRGRLTARVTFELWLTDDPAKLASYEELRAKYPSSNNWLRAGYLKSFIDGTLGSGTALMFKPFDDDARTSGLPQMSYEELERKVLAADARGFQIGIHAIGDKGNNWILNAYEKARQVNGKRDSRHRSEHAQILTDSDIQRFASLEVIASMQPTHCITDKAFAEKRIGLERCRGAYAWQRLLQNGARVAFGTDWPVEPLNPMEGLYAAVTRKSRGGEPGEGWFPDQRLTMEKAIELYTTGSAYAEFMEDRKGSLKKGMLADLIIMDRDLFTILPEEILKAKVVYTITGGKVVFQR